MREWSCAGPHLCRWAALPDGASNSVARDPAVDAWLDRRHPGKYMRHVKLKAGAAVDTSSLEALITVAYLDIKTRPGPA
jgi:hypothetical protein